MRRGASYGRTADAGLIISAKSKGNPSGSKKLMHVDVTINGRKTTALVGATQNFLSVKVADELKLRLEQNSSRIKAVNSRARPVAGLTKGVPIRMAGWSGKANFMAVLLDDFNAKGWSGLNRSPPSGPPYLNSLCILDESRAWCQL